jgi:hypothetical protein
MLMGALDAAKLQQIVASDDYRELMKGQQMADRNVEMEVTPDALEHRGVKVLKMVASGYPENPLMPDGSMETFAGAVGPYMFVTFGGKEPAAKAMIDAISDQKIERAALPGGALMDLTIDLPGMLATIRGEADEDTPAKMTMTLGKRGKALALHVVVK